MNTTPRLQRISMDGIERGGSSSPAHLSIEQEAFKHGDKYGSRSDKLQHTSTDWTDWNIRISSFIAGAKSEAAGNYWREKIAQEALVNINQHLKNKL